MRMKHVVRLDRYASQLKLHIIMQIIANHESVWKIGTVPGSKQWEYSEMRFAVNIHNLSMNSLKDNVEL